jgi:glycosyltransferase involved in cell wall biosynthesis
MAARFDVEKRHRTMVEAARELTRRGVDFELWLAGSGQLEDEVRRQVRENGLEQRVRMPGHVANAKVLEWLGDGDVDVVVLPSDAEGLSVSLIEALAYGVPAVAADAGGVAELLGEGRGEVVPPGDADALATAVERVLRSPELRAERRRLGRIRVEEEFEVGVVVRSLIDLLGFGEDDGAPSEAQADHPARAAIEDDSVPDVR